MRDASDSPEASPLPAEKARAVQRMFDAIAPRYDLLNHLLTLNIDRRWRRAAVDRLFERAPADGLILDACAGTADLAAEVAARPGFGGVIVASDFAREMLARGRAKTQGLPVRVLCADALRTPHADRAFDGAIVGFGVRNFADLDAGLRELVRILRPGAPLVVLELSVPALRPLRWLYLLYFTRVLPWIGRVVSRHGSAYSYLPASVREFPPPETLAERMAAAGLREVSFERLLGGIAAIHRGVRAP
ncbi:MAG TPA: ubiquinone/menaquinone biosynthesis methyltransferase [Longimicrobiales bacterium]|nr:ubiquinone/menaquinone biosynthesis methyltransferase [Longimicrobiales bacterium]